MILRALLIATLLATPATAAEDDPECIRLDAIAFELLDEAEPRLGDQRTPEEIDEAWARAWEALDAAIAVCAVGEVEVVFSNSPAPSCPTRSLTRRHHDAQRGASRPFTIAQQTLNAAVSGSLGQLVAKVVLGDCEHSNEPDAIGQVDHRVAQREPPVRYLPSHLDVDVGERGASREAATVRHLRNVHPPSERQGLRGRNQLGDQEPLVSRRSARGSSILPGSTESPPRGPH